MGKKKKDMSGQELNVRLSVIAALFGIALPQNNRYKNGNEPLPDDIRANKKDGEEYSTIGDVLEKGGCAKVVIIGLAILIGGGLLIYGLFQWGSLGYGVKSALDYNKAGIAEVSLDRSDLIELSKIDPDIKQLVPDFDEVFKFHTEGRLQLSLKHMENGSWTEVCTSEAKAKEGYVFVLGDPASDMSLHIISGKELQKSDIKMHNGESWERLFWSSDQITLNEERTLLIFFEDDDLYSIMNDNDEKLFPKDALEMKLPDGCYIITACSIK